MSTEELINESAKIDIELLRYLSKEGIPFKLTEQGVLIIESTNCTEEQKDKMLQIENKKKKLIMSRS